MESHKGRPFSLAPSGETLKTKTTVVMVGPPTRQIPGWSRAGLSKVFGGEGGGR